MRSLVVGLRIILRRIRVARAHSLTLVGTLASGIAAASALFSIVNGIALRELALPDPSRVVAVSAARSTDMRSAAQMSPADLAELRMRVRSLEFGAFTYSEFVLNGEPVPERVIGAMADANTFASLRAQPLYGRVFQRGEDGASPARVVLLAYQLWARRFGSDTGIVGRSIVIDGNPHTVIGVMPARFEFPRSARMSREVDLWTPLPFEISASTARGRATVFVIGRLALDATLVSASAELRAAGTDLATLYPSTNADIRFEARPLRDQIVGAVKPALAGTLVAVGVLLGILCISVAHLAVLRGLSETRATAIRVALGSSHLRSVGPLAAESLLLAAIGGAIGLVASIPLRSALLALAPDTLPRQTAVVTDWRVVVFALTLSLTVGIIASVAPTARLRKVDLRGLLNESTRSATSRGGRRWRDLFIVSEVALTTLLLAAGAALSLSMLRLQRIDPGFQPDGAVTASVSLSGPRYRSRDARAAFLEAYLSRIRTLPGVEQAASVNLLPLGGGLMSATYRVEGGDAPSDSSQSSAAAIRSVSDGYFETVGQRLLHGRAITTRDAAGAQSVAVVNEAAARRLGVRRDAIGSLLHIATGMIDTTRAYEVVGVVTDAKETDIRALATPVIYLSNRQAPYPYNNFVIRPRPGTADLTPMLRAALLEQDPNLALDEVSSLTARLRSGYALEYFLLALVSAFAGLAILLVGVGVYGVVSRVVQSQMRSLGIRLALGATPASVRRSIGGDAIRLGAVGSAAGAAGAAALWVWLPPQVLGRTLIDGPIVTLAIGVSVCFVILVCGSAAFAPARRAGRLDPLTIMRADE